MYSVPRYTLRGWHLSCYAGKVRCYPARKGVARKGVACIGKPVDFWTLAVRIKRRAGAAVMPVAVTPQGEWLQDSSVIIDTLEARHPSDPVPPPAPQQRFAARSRCGKSSACSMPTRPRQ